MRCSRNAAREYSIHLITTGSASLWCFSAPTVGALGEAQCEGNGYSVVERCNAAAGHNRDALRASLSTPTGCVAPLDKGTAIACDATAK
jgi:hypothetical protein